MLLVMNRRLRRTEGYLAVAFAAALVIGPDLAEAQDAGGTPPAASTAPQSPTPPAPPATTETPPPAPAATQTPPAAQTEQTAPQADRFSNEELRKLLAPIALYPDALLAQMLPASAYPLEIVQAERWLEKNPNLVAAKDFSGIDSQKWDPAVKAMARFPDVLRKMSQDLPWTTDLGDAIVNQPQDVAATIQQLRSEAEKSGALRSNAQQTVRRVGSGPPPSGGAAPQGEGGGGVVAPQGGGNYIAIEPTDPTMLYVPTYDPNGVWGGYPVAGPLLTWGAGIALGALATRAWWNRGTGAFYPGRGGAYGGYGGWRGGRSIPAISMSATTSMLAAAIASGARTATIALGKAASRESVIDQVGLAVLAVRVVLAAPAVPAALAAQAASADPETVLAELADPAIDPAQATVLAGQGPAIDLEALAIVQARAIVPALAELAVPAARARRTARPTGPAAPIDPPDGPAADTVIGLAAVGRAASTVAREATAAALAALGRGAALVAAGIEEAASAAGIEGAVGTAAEAAAGVPTSGSSTIWCCLGDSRTASATIASSTMAATRRMSG